MSSHTIQFYSGEEMTSSNPSNFCKSDSILMLDGIVAL